MVQHCLVLSGRLGAFTSGGVRRVTFRRYLVGQVRRVEASWGTVKCVQALSGLAGEVIMVYQWKDDKIEYSIPASVVGREFEKIEKRDGGLTNKNVLDAARPVKSPLHKAFEWDDAKAAEAYRLTQAGAMIRNLTIVVEEPEMKEAKTVRAYVNISEKREGVYVNIISSLSEKSSREKLLSDALKELSAFQRKYQTLSELAEVFKAISEVEKVA